MDVGKLAAAHVSRFNTCVAVGDFGSVAESFAEDGRLTFTDLDAGPFTGRKAVAGAYRDDPPDDTIELLGVQVTGPASAVAAYTWTSDPERRPGLIEMTWTAGGLIAEMEIGLP